LVCDEDGNDIKEKRQTITRRDPRDSNTDWGGVLSALLDACDAARKGASSSYHCAQTRVHSSLNHIFGMTKGNVLVPALHIVCRNTYRTALLADVHAASGRIKKFKGIGDDDCNENRRHNNDRANLSGAVTLLQESFSKSLNDRKEFVPDAPLGEDGSKKAGVLYIVNQLFSMYFRLNTLRLCKNLVKPVEGRNLHEKGHKGEMVTYRYYVGRLSMFEDQFSNAEGHLEYSLRHCYKGAYLNKRRILEYLIPVKMLRGRLPSLKLLSKYNLQEFAPLVKGVCNGDIRMFNSALSSRRDLFIQRGTYLLLERCKTVCYRNLLRRICAISADSHQLPLGNVEKVFSFLGTPIDLDEVECILANLIFRGYIRGYISHSKRILVLSSKNPFPKSAVVKE